MARKLILILFLLLGCDRYIYKGEMYLQKNHCYLFSYIGDHPIEIITIDSYKDKDYIIVYRYNFRGSIKFVVGKWSQLGFKIASEIDCKLKGFK